MHSSQFSRVLCNVAYVDLHSYLSLEHGRSCRCPSLVVESEGQWRKHTMLKIRNLKPEKAANESKAKQRPKSRKDQQRRLIFFQRLYCSIFGHYPWTTLKNNCLRFLSFLSSLLENIFALEPITLQLLDICICHQRSSGLFCYQPSTVNTITRCLKITEKVSFNIASEACGQTVLPDR